MKKLLITSLLFSLAVSVNAAWLTTNLNNGLTVGGNFPLVGQDAKIKSIQFVTGTAASAFLFRDCTTADTNSHFSAYNSIGSYSTNIVTSYVTTTGTTNIYTNSGIFTYTNTVSAGSNAFPVLWTVSVPASTTTAIYTPDINFSKGITVSTTGTNVTIIMEYDSLY